MSSKNSKNTIADNARREAKLLAKPTKLTLDPFGKTDVELKQPFPKELGEYAVIVIATPMTTVQFTIAHPIGITDLPAQSWVAHRSDQLQGMLVRAKDPNQASLDQSRTITRQRLAVAAKLLIEKELHGKKVFYYPHRNDTDRNQLLEHARAQAKEATSQIKAQIANLKEGEKHEKQGLMNQLRDAENPLTHMDEATSKAEDELRKFYQKPEVLKAVLTENPQAYRTLSGPYFTVPQVPIPHSDTLRLEDVAIRFARNLANGSAVPVAKSLSATAEPVAKPIGKPSGDAADPLDGLMGVNNRDPDALDPDTGKKTIMSRLTGKSSKVKTGADT